MSHPVMATLTGCVLAAAVSLTLIGSSALAAGPSKPAGLGARPMAATPAPATSFSRYIVRYRTGTTAAKALTNARNAFTRSGLANSRTLHHVRRMFNGADVFAVSKPLDAAASKALMAQLKADPSVAYVAPDRRFQHTAMMPNDPGYTTYQWHYSDDIGGIYAPAAWDGATGSGVVVAVLDTGITEHPDLDANILSGYDFITDARVSRRRTDEREPGAHDYGDWNDDLTLCGSSPSSFHGTHVTGTIAEVTNNGVGLAGVAHDAKVLPVRVLGRCGGYESDIADAVVWASGGHVDGVPDNTTPAEVINMSLGGFGACEAMMQDAINSAVSRGTTVVVAAGNAGVDASQYSPASCANTITVGASGSTGGAAYYSNYGTNVDLTAPGGDGWNGARGYIWSTINDSQTAPENGKPWYGGSAGTSMASPHVAATVALLQSISSTPLTPAQVEATLKATARPFPTQPAVAMGTGILNAKAVVETVFPCQGATCEANATAMSNKVPVRFLGGTAGSERMFAIKVPAGAANLSFLTYGGTGDVTLQVRYGQTPTAASQGWTSARVGNNETIRMTVTYAGTYYVKVTGRSAYSGVTVEARHY